MITLLTLVNRTRGRVPRRRLQRLLARAGKKLSDRSTPRISAIALVFITPSESRRLKRRFLGQDRAADVLSFRYGNEGEIFLSPGVIRSEARMSGKSYDRLLDEMLLHGLLHLYGYHHEGSSLRTRRFAAHERALHRCLGLTR